MRKLNEASFITRIIRSKTWTFWLLLFLFYLPLGAAVVTSIAMLSYIHWPFRHFDIALPEQITASNLTIITHGVHDDTNGWVSEFAAQISATSDTDVIALDWSHYSRNPLTCSVNGERIGRLVANEFKDFKQIQNVTMVGHSCGAFVIYGFCDEFKALGKQTDIHTIYLDPISIYGGLQKNYGRDRFGTCETTSVQYYDTDDNVIGSNAPFPHVKSVDVTDFKAQYGYSGNAHKWPIYYLLETF